MRNRKIHYVGTEREAILWPDTDRCQIIVQYDLRDVHYSVL